MLCKRIKYSFLLLIVLILSSCVTNRDTRYLQDTKVKYAKGEYVDYRLQIGDEVYVQVFCLNQDVSNMFIVSPQSGGGQAGTMTYRLFDDGTIDLSYVHKIKLLGLTVQEAELEVKRRLTEYISDDFSVKVVMAEKAFYVVGEQTSICQIYKDRLNIFEAIALAGDFKQNVDKRNIRILRKLSNGENQIIKFDLRSKSIVDSEYYYIQPNDIIILNRSKSNFYKINSFTGFVGMVTSTLSFALIILQYSK